VVVHYASFDVVVHYASFDVVVHYASFDVHYASFDVVAGPFLLLSLLSGPLKNIVSFYSAPPNTV